MSLLGWFTQTPAHSVTTSDSMTTGSELLPGQSLVSANGQFTLALNDVGQIQLTDAWNVVMWSNSTGQPVITPRLVLQSDGNLVEYDDHTPVWSSRTEGSGATVLTVQVDGNVVLRAGPTAVFSSGTGVTPLVQSVATGSPTSTQVVTVVGSPSTARLAAFQLTNGVWQLRFPVASATIGRHGWSTARHRREGDGTTPLGTYAIGSTVYGTAPLPPTQLTYHQLVRGDFWDENPSTGRLYNTFQHRNVGCAHEPFGGDSECMWLSPIAYRYVLVIGFNMPTKGPFGSAIFVHVGNAPTGGCVAIGVQPLRALLGWLTPGASPHIALSRWA